jgi:hypothetical protein
MMIYLRILYLNFFTILSSTIIKPKFCVDCKFYKKEFFFSSNKFGKCSLYLYPIPINKYFLVDGTNEKKEYMYCSVVRNGEDMCGSEGKFYEKKNNNIFKRENK